MRLVVDSNIVFAGLLRDGITRRLLVHPPVELVAPEWMLSEIRKYREEIAGRARLSADEVDLLLGLLTAAIDVVPRGGYAARMEDAERMEDADRRIGARDPGDVPFLALALALGCDGIWTQNVSHFEGAGVEIWTTERLVEWARARPKW